jgi:hypothetical protein
MVYSCDQAFKAKPAFEYHGNKFVNDFEYTFSKMVSDICFDLLLWWHLPN